LGFDASHELVGLFVVLAFDAEFVVDEFGQSFVADFERVS